MRIRTRGQTYLFSIATGWIGLSCLVSLPVGAQNFPPSNRCLAETESCAYQDYPQYNQRVNYRTPQQIQQRRVNSIENQCGASNSRTCNHLLPAVETIQETPVLQELRDRQIETLENGR
ncbi:hypothetical protein V0288_07650 [Pannus brasiliensis CCIBt3594]|uniref:Uncharacterized protein n=1 Tax=Pannus brasiliensis CCIBt3594 TaxID=1427578 RepID=A0AAW9QQH2_9CHRO